MAFGTRDSGSGIPTCCSGTFCFYVELFSNLLRSDLKPELNAHVAKAQSRSTNKISGLRKNRLRIFVPLFTKVAH